MFQSITVRALLLALLIHSLWGGNPVALKFSVLVFPPLWSAFFRFVLGIVCVYLWCRWSGKDVWPKRGEWRVLSLIAGLFAVQIACMNIGYANTTGVMGAVLIASNPVFAVIFTHYLLASERLHLGKALGLVLGFAGTALVLLEDAGPGQIQLGAWGNWMVLLSASLLGLRLGLSAKALRAIDPVRVAMWQMLIALPFFGAGAVMLETIHWQALAWPPVAGLLFQGIVIAGFCFAAQFYLMQKYSPSLMVSFNFVSPIAGVLFGMWLLDEAVGLYFLVGLAMVAVALLLIARRSPDQGSMAGA